MPEFRGIEVHVTNHQGVNLQEWGTHTFRKHKRISTYIESVSDMRFMVNIKPRIPYIDENSTQPHDFEIRSPDRLPPGSLDKKNEWTNEEDLKGQKIYQRNGWKIRQDETSNNSSGLLDIKLHTTHHNSATGRSKAVKENLVHRPCFPFHFLAMIYLDGRSIPERRYVIYLDPEDEDFRLQTTLRGRLTCNPDGKIVEYSWHFQDVGVETVFDKLIISGEPKSSNFIIQEEEKLLSAMKKVVMGATNPHAEEGNPQPGQIVIKLRRVILGEKGADPDFKGAHEMGKNEDVNMKNAGDNVSHTTGFKENGAVYRNHNIRTVKHYPFDPNEEFYAIFQFFYRSKEVLRKFDFPGFSPAKSSGHNRAYHNLNDIVARTTSLSVNHSLLLQKNASKASETKGTKTISFEDKLRNGKTTLDEHYRYNLRGGSRGSMDGPENSPSSSASPTKKSGSRFSKVRHSITRSISSETAFADVSSSSAEPSRNQSTTDIQGIVRHGADVPLSKMKNELTFNKSNIEATLEKNQKKRGGDIEELLKDLKNRDLRQFSSNDADDEEDSDNHNIPTSNSDVGTDMQGQDGGLAGNADDYGLHNALEKVTIGKKHGRDAVQSHKRDPTTTDPESTGNKEDNSKTGGYENDRMTRQKKRRCDVAGGSRF
ncbi:MAG: hypothetical protein M1834_009141 [Cirrosporium novae-zelandiae]|nr:MAG: hypothetical protein M1834_009141 [Cirrosporium novae-zelandiae]